jgi:hypothetical protein
MKILLDIHSIVQTIYGYSYSKNELRPFFFTFSSLFFTRKDLPGPLERLRSAR